MYFSIIDDNDDLVILEIVYENEMDKISHPYLVGLEKYVKVLKGKRSEIYTYDENKQILSIIDACTLIREERIKGYAQMIYDFLSNEKISLSPKLACQEFKILYNEEHLNELFVEVQGKRIATYESLEILKKELGDFEVISQEYDYIREMVELQVRKKIV